MRHFGMKPRTTEVGAKEQNGDVEAANGALKRALEQALLVRGSRDFDSRDAWQSFVDDVMRKANRNRGHRVTEDMEAMRELNVARLPDFVEEGLLRQRVEHRARQALRILRPFAAHRRVGARAHLRRQDRGLVRGQRAARVRATARPQSASHRLSPRHLVARAQAGRIRALRLPRGDVPLARLSAARTTRSRSPHRGLKGDLEYLRILHLAASTLEADVEAALALLLADGKAITADAVKALVTRHDDDRRAGARAPAGRPRHLRRPARGGRHMSASRRVAWRPRPSSRSR